MKRPTLISPLPAAGRPVLLLLAILLLAACGPRAQNGPARPAAQRPRSTATLRILTPAPGAVVTGRTLQARLELTGATITPETSTNLKPDRGHIHLILDGRVVSMSYGLEQTVPVTPGDHLMQAEFVATDHFPFNPRVVTSATFTVK
ncbi:MAG TPA: hypothetical protein VKT83_01460 [bacterium]|nr:hypothetical protein [bacterium]